MVCVRNRCWNSINNFGMFDASGLSQKPGSNNSAAETFRKAAAWTILFDNGMHYCSLVQIVGGKRYNLASRL
jgi:hypothetical protein